MKPFQRICLRIVYSVRSILLFIVNFIKNIYKTDLNLIQNTWSAADCIDSSLTIFEINKFRLKLHKCVKKKQTSIHVHVKAQHQEESNKGIWEKEIHNSKSSQSCASVLFLQTLPHWRSSRPRWWYYSSLERYNPDHLPCDILDADHLRIGSHDFPQLPTMQTCRSLLGDSS